MSAHQRAVPEPRRSTHATAAVLVIGNEILSGKVTDTNSPYLAAELRRLGVNLRRIEVVPDEIEQIRSAVARMSAEYTWVFTSGGVGPTHDDCTMAGIAASFGESVVRHPFLEKLLHQYYGDKTNEARLRMADVPHGAEVLFGDGITIPVVHMRNVFILPGVPDLFRRQFDSVRDRFQAAPFHTQRIYVTLSEGDLVEVLEIVTATHLDVDIGSYPRFERDLDFRVMLTVDSRSPETTGAAVQRLLELLPQDCVRRVE
jgi:molybdenum cofactor synthesis domain-containing protein